MESNTSSGTVNPSAASTGSFTADALSGYGTFYISSTNTGNADLAEYYVTGDKTISAGDVLTISDTRVIASDSEAILTMRLPRRLRLLAMTRR